MNATTLERHRERQQRVLDLLAEEEQAVAERAWLRGKGLPPEDVVQPEARELARRIEAARGDLEQAFHEARRLW